MIVTTTTHQVVLIGNELADEEAELGSVERQPLVALDPASRRALIGLACTSNFGSTSPQAAIYTFSSARRRSPVQVPNG